MKKVLNLITFIVLTFLNVTKSENAEVNVCNAGESCVRLCCDSNAPHSECSDLNLMPKDKKFKQGFKVLKGRPCKEMFVEEDPWEFLEVRSSYIINEQKLFLNVSKRV